MDSFTRSGTKYNVAVKLPSGEILTFAEVEKRARDSLNVEDRAYYANLLIGGKEVAEPPLLPQPSQYRAPEAQPENLFSPLGASPGPRLSDRSTSPLSQLGDLEEFDPDSEGNIREVDASTLSPSSTRSNTPSIVETPIPAHQPVVLIIVEDEVVDLRFLHIIEQINMADARRTQGLEKDALKVTLKKLGNPDGTSNKEVANWFREINMLPEANRAEYAQHTAQGALKVAIGAAADMAAITVIILAKYLGPRYKHEQYRQLITLR